jgi:hypothetical protein
MKSGVLKATKVLLMETVCSWNVAIYLEVYTAFVLGTFAVYLEVYMAFVLGTLLST